MPSNFKYTDGDHKIYIVCKSSLDATMWPTVWHVQIDCYGQVSNSSLVSKTGTLPTSFEDLAFWGINKGCGLNKEYWLPIIDKLLIIMCALAAEDEDMCGTRLAKPDVKRRNAAK